MAATPIAFGSTLYWCVDADASVPFWYLHKACFAFPPTSEVQCFNQLLTPP